MRKIQYPWIVLKDVINFTGREGDDDYDDYRLDILQNRKNLIDIGGINVASVEKTFEEATSPESKKLSRIVSDVQKAAGEGKEGVFIITNSPEEVAVYVEALAYIWSCTLNKSAFITDTKAACTLIYKSATAFGDYQEQINMLRYSSILCLTYFAPVLSKSFQNTASEIGSVLYHRINKIEDSFTVMVGFTELPSTEGLKGSVPAIIENQWQAIGNSYGNDIKALLRRSTSVIVLPIAEVDQTASVVL